MIKYLNVCLPPGTAFETVSPPHKRSRQPVMAAHGAIGYLAPGRGRNIISGLGWSICYTLSDSGGWDRKGGL